MQALDSIIMMMHRIPKEHVEHGMSCAGRLRADVRHNNYPIRISYSIYFLVIYLIFIVSGVVIKELHPKRF